MTTLYAVLGVAKDADGPSIKRAYLKAARKTHPDKCTSDDQATERFQEVGRAYTILSDPERRKLYDETGMMDESVGDGASFWREVFERVSLEKLDELAEGYRRTAEETADLCKHYSACKGDIGKVMDLMLFSTAEDEPRFRETVQRLIDTGHLKPYRAFAAEPAGKKKARDGRAAREALEAEESARELGLRSQGGGSDADALRSALALRDATRKGQFGHMIASLEERFGEKAGKGGKHKKARGGGGEARASAALEDPLGDEAFAAAQTRMLKKGKGGR